MARRDEDDTLDAELEAEDPEGAWLRVYLQKTPWWVLSILFHGLVLACLGLITFSKDVLFDDAPFTIMPPAARAERLPEQTARRAIFDHESLARADTEQPVEPAVIDPLATPADHTESEDDMDRRSRRGESLEFITTMPGRTGGAGRQPGATKAVTDIMGTGEGGGSGGNNGRPDGGGMRRLRSIGCGGPTQSAVLAGLRWLARHQNPDGGWSAGGFDQRCATGTRCSGAGIEQFDVGVSGLAVLAFLGAGKTHLSRDHFTDPGTGREVRFGDVVRRGVEFLIRQQDGDGCFGPRQGEFMYNHAIATLAVVEAYGMTTPIGYKAPAQRGIDFLISAQNPALGWRYSVQPGQNDTSCTGWAVMALKSAHLSGLEVPRASFEGARAWLDRVTDSSGQVGYTAMGAADVFVPGKNEAWRSHPSMTAIGLLLRIYIDPDASDPLLAKGGKLIAADLPRWDAPKHEVDCYYWYYATLALYQYKDVPGGMSCWSRWNEAMMAALLPSQRVKADGCLDGSWDPEVDRWGYAGGRVYLTAVNTMTLEVYYRYAGVFGKDAAAPAHVGGR